MIGGKDSGADALIAAAGGRDMGTALGIEELQAAHARSRSLAGQPDVILVLSAGPAVGRRCRGLLRIPGWRRLRPARTERVVVTTTSYCWGSGRARGWRCGSCSRPSPGGPEPLARRWVGCGRARRPQRSRGDRRWRSSAGLFFGASRASCCWKGSGSVRFGRATRGDRDRDPPSRVDLGSTAARGRRDPLVDPVSARAARRAGRRRARISGAALQGLFRNPLADPGLIGVSSGASVGAVAAIVFGARRGVPRGLAALRVRLRRPAALGVWARARRGAHRRRR